MSYRKVVKTSCSLLEDDACWEKTRGKLHLTRFNKPSCEEGYKNSLDQIAKNRCQSVRDDSAECYSMRLHEAATKYENAPSMLSYPAQLNLVGDKMTPTPVTGGVECWLAYE